LPERKLQPDAVTYGILIEACLGENDLDRATEVIDMVISSGNKLNTVLFTTFMKGFVRNGMLDRAMGLYETMRRAMSQGEEAARPDLITYSILIRANCEQRSLDQALRLLNDMTEDNVVPDSVLLNHLLEGCCYASNAELGQHLFDKMVTSFKVQPSHFTLATMVKLYGKCGLCDSAEKFIISMEEKFGHKPSVITYTCFMSGCVRHGKLDQAWNAYLAMRDVFALKPDKMVFSTLIPAFSQDACRTRRLTQDAKELGIVVPTPFKPRQTSSSW